MRIVSMVPSWTETLVECGCEVVGRTRFCIHPAKVREVPVVGGTKTINWDRVRSLNADLLLLDREENTLAMRDESPLEVLATHVTSVADVATELTRIAERCGSDQLRALAGRWSKALARPEQPIASWQELPGVIEWIRDPASPAVGSFAYLIWRDPWMAIGPETFIASMLAKVGLPRDLLLPRTAHKYPEFDPAGLPGGTVLLASSEPYPFEHKRDALIALDRPVAIVDGESFSWFGLRSLAFLERAGAARYIASP